MRISGTVQDNGDPLVSLRVRGPDGSIARIDAIVDTGFNRELTLPRSLVELLHLELRESARFTLADGSVSAEQQFAADVEWFGSWRGVLAVRTEGEPLVGMELLGGCRLTMDAVPNGSITIVPLR